MISERDASLSQSADDEPQLVKPRTAFSGLISITAEAAISWIVVTSDAGLLAYRDTQSGRAASPHACHLRQAVNRLGLQ